MDYSQRALDFGVATATTTAFFLTTYFLLNVTQKGVNGKLEQKTLEERRGISLKVISLLHSSYVGSCAIIGLLSDPKLAHSTYLSLTFNSTGLREGPIEHMLFDDLEICNQLIPILTAFMIYELVLFNHWSQQTSQMAMVIHHVAIILLFPLATIFCTAQWFLVFLCTYEASTPFLCFKYFIEKEIGKDNLLFKLNGILFALSFLLVRNATGPSFIFASLHSIPYIHQNSIVALLPFCCFIPFGLNTLWGYKLIQGIQKTLTKQKEN